MSSMTLKEVAAAAELKPETIRRLHAEASKARRESRETSRHMPAPTGVAENGALTWTAGAINNWIAERAKPVRKGAVPKSVLQQAIKEIKRNRPNAALRVLEGAL